MNTRATEGNGRSTAAVLAALAGAIDSHVSEGRERTAIPRLELVSTDHPVEPFAVVYSPMVCFIAAGSKETRIGTRTATPAAGSYLVSALEVPVTTWLRGAPYRAVTLHLDEDVLAGMLLELGDTEAEAEEEEEPVSVATYEATPRLLDAVLRLVELLDQPDDIPALAGRTEAEIVYRLLQGPAGPTLRQLAFANSRLTQIRAAAHWIRTHYREPLRIEDVATVATMSKSTLQRQFRRATGMSPLQFQKTLRLEEVRRLLLAGKQASAAGAAVGYRSPSQMSRDYVKAFGVPPGDDALRMRSSAGPSIDPVPLS